MFPLTQMQRGILFIFIGALILLNGLNIIRYDLFLVALGAYLILDGLMVTGYYNKLIGMIKKGNKPDRPAS